MLVMEQQEEQKQKHPLRRKTDQQPQVSAPSPVSISESEARAMIRILAGEFGFKPRVVFSSRIQKSLQTPCYYRPTPIILPSEKSGLLTESVVAHDVAHMLDLEDHKPKPHGESFREHLQKVQRAWWGAERRQQEGR